MLYTSTNFKLGPLWLFSITLARLIPVMGKKINKDKISIIITY
jgi:hypothetical protein